MIDKFLDLLVWIYNLKVDPNYTTLKRFFKKKDLWPYMLNISNVKSSEQQVENQQCIIMSSYSYLGNHANEETQNAALMAGLSYSTGSHGPRMLLGNTDLFSILEDKISRIFQKDSAIVTNSGYMACLGAVSVAAKGKIIFYDARCHNSLVSGMKLSESKMIKFKHNDFKDLENKLRFSFSSKQRLVIIESLYSMDGTIPDLHALEKLKKKYNLTILIDEAHGLGTLGPTGKGIEEHCDIRISDIIVGTFSKSMSNLGGYICGTQSFIDTCEYYSVSNIFTAGLSAYHIAGTIQALNVLKDKSTIHDLRENRIYMREKLKDAAESLDFEVGGDENSVVIPIIYNFDILRIIDIAYKMRMYGFAIAPVLPPACSYKKPRFRITATSWYTKMDIDRFVEKFVQVNLETKSRMDKSKLNWYSVLFHQIYFYFMNIKFQNLFNY
jgi:7-keto-8-aminopelargonate synthetase-like enzyme